MCLTFWRRANRGIGNDVETVPINGWHCHRRKSFRNKCLYHNSSSLRGDSTDMLNSCRTSLAYSHDHTTRRIENGPHFEHKMFRHRRASIGWHRHQLTNRRWHHLLWAYFEALYNHCAQDYKACFSIHQQVDASIGWDDHSQSYMNMQNLWTLTTILNGLLPEVVPSCLGGVTPRISPINDESEHDAFAASRGVRTRLCCWSSVL